MKLPLASFYFDPSPFQENLENYPSSAYLTPSKIKLSTEKSKSFHCIRKCRVRKIWTIKAPFEKFLSMRLMVRLMTVSLDTFHVLKDRWKLVSGADSEKVTLTNWKKEYICWYILTVGLQPETVDIFAKYLKEKHFIGNLTCGVKIY